MENVDRFEKKLLIRGIEWEESKEAIKYLIPIKGRMATLTLFYVSVIVFFSMNYFTTIFAKSKSENAKSKSEKLVY
jgi:hypothetical protein